MTQSEDIIGRLDQFTGIQRELEEILQTLVLNDSTIIDALARMMGQIAKLNAQAEQAQTRMGADIRSLIATVADLRAPPLQGDPIVAPPDAFSALNPEVSLLQYLSSVVDDRTAVDVGAHVGDVAERLLDSGWRTYAFEPYPASFEALQERLGGRVDFKALPLAIGAADREGQLNIAETVIEGESLDASLFHSLVDHPLGASVRFAGALPVKVRSLASLRRTGEIPERIGLLKIDAEGADIEVLKGLGEPDVPIVMTEYWDAAHAFGKGAHGHLSPTVELMRSIGYAWYIVIYHVDEHEVISYYSNHPHTIPGSWGNAIFFEDRSLFARAARWCEAALRPTLRR